MTTLDLSALWKLAPHALPSMRTAFLAVDAALRPFGVLETRLRTEHFLAQVLHETGGLRVVKENLNYSVKNLMATWPARFPTADAAAPFAHKPRTLANKVYGGRMGNTGPDDGWAYVGRGLLMLTGRNGYQRVGNALALEGEFLDDPDLVLTPLYALQVAGVIWTSAGCNAHADADALQRVSRAINGGLVGLQDRKAWLAKVRENSVAKELA